MAKSVDLYNTTYSRFSTDLAAEMRREIYGEDIGQNSWLTADEQLGFARKAGWTADTRLLEVGCGSGGPALFLAHKVGLSVTGVDINEAGIAAANEAANVAGLSGRARFTCVDGGGRLPFADGSFDAVQSIDAINHIPDRTALLTELHRLLRLGGTLLYTDPVIVTGPVSAEELAIRSSIGFFLFVPPGENERVLKACGFELLAAEDVTENTAMVSAGWVRAREKFRDQLIEANGRENYEGTLRFSRAVHAMSSSRRLSRFMFLARRK